MRNIEHYLVRMISLEPTNNFILVSFIFEYQALLDTKRLLNSVRLLALLRILLFSLSNKLSTL